MVGGGEGLEAKAQVVATLLELSLCKAQAETSTIEIDCHPGAYPLSHTRCCEDLITPVVAGAAPVVAGT